MMMEEQVDRCRRERDENIKASEVVKGVLTTLEGVLGAGMGVVGGIDVGPDGEGNENTLRSGVQEMDQTARESDLELWRALESICGVHTS